MEVLKKSIISGFMLWLVIGSALATVLALFYDPFTLPVLHKAFGLIVLFLMCLLGKFCFVSTGFVKKERDEANRQKKEDDKKISSLNKMIEEMGVDLVPIAKVVKHELGGRPLILIPRHAFQIGQLLALHIDVGGALVNLGIMEVKGKEENGLFKCELVFKKAIHKADEYLGDDSRQPSMFAKGILVLDDLKSTYQVEGE